MGLQDQQMTSVNSNGVIRKHALRRSDLYITFDVKESAGDLVALFPKVKKVHITGEVKGWMVGIFRRVYGKRRRKFMGVKIEFDQIRKRYLQNSGYSTTSLPSNEALNQPRKISETRSTVSTIIEVPANAENIQFRIGTLPERYQGVEVL